MKDFINSRFVKELSEAATNMYRLGWDERNGGNISYLLDYEDIKEFFPVVKPLRQINIPCPISEKLYNRYFLFTGTGKYFKNVLNNPTNCLGLIHISSDGRTADIIWGFEGGGAPTSEFPAHLLSHGARLSTNPKNRIIMHTHPTYTICMGACLPTDETVFTRKLWKSNTEAVVVFPEGIGVLPCMLCGTNEIGEATAEKMKTFRIVSWTNHGIYGAGETMDEAFGLIETVEKTAQIYMITLGHVVNEIPDDVIIGLAKLWHLKTMKGVIEGLDK